MDKNTCPDVHSYNEHGQCDDCREWRGNDENFIKACNFADEMRGMGYAVVFFTPEDLQGVDAEEVEGYLTEKGNEVIEEWSL